jgi:starvation-inducible outer membrane lipoprotein
MSARKLLALLLTLAVAACATHPQQCDGPWQPINPAAPPAHVQHSPDAPAATP